MIMNKFMKATDEAMLIYRDENGAIQIAIDLNRKGDPHVQQRVKELLSENEINDENITFVDLNKLQDLKEIHASSGPDDASASSENQSAVIKYFTEAVNCKASDIHFTIKENSTIVEMRINGELYPKDVITREKGLAYAKTIIFSMCDIAEPSFQSSRRQDARLAEKYAKQAGLFAARYCHLPTDEGLLVVMRTIANDSQNVQSLKELGFLDEHIKLLEKIQRTPEGMMILSGPTGSGKSTTLRTINANYVERTKGLKRLITIEDPPEGKIAGAIHTPVLPKDRSNPESLRQAWLDSMSAMMRLDPDAILLGEVREYESAMAAINAALTGHFMSTTVHSNDAVSILERLVIIGVNKELIADAGLVIGLVSQRLAQTLCHECKIPWSAKKATLSPETVSYLEENLQLNGKAIFEGSFFRNYEGCKHCTHSIGEKDAGGINGRTVISEVIRPTAEFMTIYRNQGASEARNYWRNKMGGITRVTHALHKIAEGVLDPLVADSICPLDEDKFIYRDPEVAL